MNNEDIILRRELLCAVGFPSPVRPDIEPEPKVARLPIRRPVATVSCCLALIATRNFLPFAKLAARSFLAHHPEFRAFLLLVDGDRSDAPEFSEGHVVLLSDLGMSDVGWYAAKFTASEFANALKPSFLRYLSGIRRVRDLSRLRYRGVQPADRDDRSDGDQRSGACPAHARAAATPGAILDPSDASRHLQLRSGQCRKLWHQSWLDAVNSWRFGRRRTLRRAPFMKEPGYQTDQQHLNWALVTVPGACVLRESRYNVAYWNLHDRDLRV